MEALHNIFYEFSENTRASYLTSIDNGRGDYVASVFREAADRLN
jgi:hypothetical protein